MKTCPACNQPIIPDDIPLSPIKARILRTVRARPGISGEALRTVVWANDPDGGPENRKCLHVHIWQLNRVLAPRGIAVRGSPWTGYRVQPLADRVLA